MLEEVEDLLELTQVTLDDVFAKIGYTCKPDLVVIQNVIVDFIELETIDLGEHKIFTVVLVRFIIMG